MHNKNIKENIKMNKIDKNKLLTAGQVIAMLPRNLKHQLKIQCAKDGISMRDKFLELIVEYLKEKGAIDKNWKE
jgi:hypothetical protein